MSFEVEIKYRVHDIAALRRQLLAIQAEAGPSVQQEDTYLAHPARDFARTDEAFRIRRIGDENRVTYKGPKHAGPTKTREEIEVRFSDGGETHEDLARLLDRLGFLAVATIRKTRSTAVLERLGRKIEVAIDEAPGLGTFAEVEAIAAGPDDLQEAQDAVIEIARSLGLTEVEPRSYLRMTLAKGLGNSAGPT